MRRLVELCAAAVLGAFSCVPEDDAPAPFDNAQATNLACVPGEQRQCACPANASGVQVCDGDGQRLLPCECSVTPSGSCTLYPDCRGCAGCFETCICHSQGDVAGCFRTCGLGDGGTDASADGGLECVAGGRCAPPPRSGIGCCTEEGKCGLVLPPLGPECLELNQPGTVDTECPALEAPGLRFDGCCRPDGHCGVLETIFPLGCVAREAFAPDSSTSCTPNGS